jgi:coproporphyrinogen III oxidase
MPTPVSIQQQAEEYFQHLQKVICEELERVDEGKQFSEDRWTHATGGGGITNVLQHGKIFEKAGVNFSAVDTFLSELLATRLKTTPQKVFATGISLVLHPYSPMVPTVHMNLRFLRLDDGEMWFGGGTDLTPWYLFEDDARHFHTTLKTACDKHSPEYYGRFKKWCDEYFSVKHRKETRGIGGVFFDYLRDSPEATFLFAKEIGNAFLPAYLPIIERRRNEPWGTLEKEWQRVRRGRYVEFNLVYDRGTLFGLETGGRVESILMSLPPEVEWKYNYSPAAGSREQRLIDVLQQPKSWI